MKNLVNILLVIVLFTNACNYFKNKNEGMVKVSEIEKLRIADSLKFVNELNRIKEESAKRIDSLNSVYVYPVYTYYVITGSFKNPANAENYANDMMNLGYKSHIITISNGFHLVSASSGDDPGQANEALRNIQQSVNPEAWIFVNK